MSVSSSRSKAIAASGRWKQTSTSKPTAFGSLPPLRQQLGRVDGGLVAAGVGPDSSFFVVADLAAELCFQGVADFADVAVAAGELLDHGVADAGDLPHAVGSLPPAEPEVAQLPAGRGGGQRRRRRGVQVQGAGVEGADPAEVVDDGVGDDVVVVRVRVEGP